MQVANRWTIPGIIAGAIAAASCNGERGDPATAGETTGAAPTSGDTSADPTAAETGAPTTAGMTEGTGSSGQTGAVTMCPDLGDPCTACEASECPADYCACFNNGSCGLLAQCVADCASDDAACDQACWTLHPDGISDGALLTHCAATTCESACGPYAPLSPCQLCLYDECADAMNQCVSNPDCTALLECLDACDAPGCENTCYTAFPGLADSGPVGLCAQDRCASECQ